MYLRKCLVLVYGAMVIPFVGISADNVNVALHKQVIAKRISCIQCNRRNYFAQIFLDKCQRRSYPAYAGS